MLAGLDPAVFAREYADRVVHVHLKDVSASLAGELRSGLHTLVSATRRSLFLPLGRGDARIGAVLAALDEHGYDRWLVLEQDTTITADESAVGSDPMLTPRRNLSSQVQFDIQNGTMVSAVDQQQYLQGYLPIVLLYLYKKHEGQTAGDGGERSANRRQDEHQQGLCCNRRTRRLSASRSPGASPGAPAASSSLPKGR